MNDLLMTPHLMGQRTKGSAEANAIQDMERAQVEKLGQEFEGVFLSFLLKEMRNTVEGGLFAGDSSDTYGGMFDMFLGQNLAKSKPLGISDMLVQKYEKQNQRNHTNEAESGQSRIETEG